MEGLQLLADNNGSSRGRAKKRKADCLGRVAAASGRCGEGGTTRSRETATTVGAVAGGNRGGRGSLTGWTTCPLCGRHSSKRYALGRGIATHLHAVHTPWNPGPTERKRRRRLAERRANDKWRTAAVDDEQGLETVVEEERESWLPTLKEMDEWDVKVLQIVADLEAAPTTTAQSNNNASDGVKRVRPGLDRNGRKSQDYRESLPEFIQAAADGDLGRLQTIVQKISKTDGPIGIRELLHTRDRHLSSAEHWAAGGGHLQCLELLLQLRRDQHGEQADPTVTKTKAKRTRRRDGKTCLHFAARNGHLKCVQFLVEDQKFVVDEVSGDGTTPMHMACFGGHVDVANYLIENGANVHATNEWGCGAAHWVGMTRSTSEAEVRKLCRLLHSQGACFVTRQKHGHTALHKAAQKLNRPVIEYMAQSSLDGGAGLTADQRIQVGLPDHGGHTASEIWRSVGGDEEFAKRMKDEWGW